MSGFTGIRIEPHARDSGKELFVVYQDGKRVAALYYHPEERKARVIYEGGKVGLEVIRRTPGTYTTVTAYKDFLETVSPE